MMDLHNDHNVYILGAGFSADRGMPLINNFMFRMRDAHEWLLQQDRKHEASAITNVLKFRKEAASAAYRVKINLENIEELFSLASASGNKENNLSGDIRIAIAATLDFCSTNQPELKFSIRTKGAMPSFESYGCDDDFGGGVLYENIPIYRYYLDSMLGSQGVSRGENTFISFNYDTIVEDALTSMGVGFTYGFHKVDATYNTSRLKFESNGLRLLKLHGSINWTREKISHSNDTPLQIYDSYQEVREKSATPDLIPPTWRKNFDGGLETIWGHALKAIESATRIIVIGFSVPETDTHFKYLMAAGLQNNISAREIVFVNPASDGILETRISALFTNPESSRVRLIKKTTSDFLQGQSEIAERDNISSCGRGIHYYPKH
jgi:SIR2-like domain